MNGTNRPLVKPKRKMVSSLIHNLLLVNNLNKEVAPHLDSQKLQSSQPASERILSRNVHTADSFEICIFAGILLTFVIIYVL